MARLAADAWMTGRGMGALVEFFPKFALSLVQVPARMAVHRVSFIILPLGSPLQELLSLAASQI